jgi:hypothetical protein
MRRIGASELGRRRGRCCRHRCRGSLDGSGRYGGRSGCGSRSRCDSRSRFTRCWSRRWRSLLRARSESRGRSGRRVHRALREQDETLAPVDVMVLDRLPHRSGVGLSGTLGAGQRRLARTGRKVLQAREVRNVGRRRGSGVRRSRRSGRWGRDRGAGWVLRIHRLRGCDRGHDRRSGTSRPEPGCPGECSDVHVQREPLVYSGATCKAFRSSTGFVTCRLPRRSKINPDSIVRHQ